MEKNNKAGYLSFVIIIAVFIGFVYLFPSVPRNIGTFYTHLINPAAWFSGAPVITEPDSVMYSVTSFKANLYKLEAEGYRINTDSSSGPLEAGLRENFFTRILTFGNSEALHNLKAAQVGGQYSTQYAVFIYDAKGNAIYLAKTLDAPSVLVYGYSWLVNLPSSILAQIKGLSEFNKVYYNTGVGFYLDIAINILATIFIELPIAFFNTIIGFIIALVFNPLDSVCSLLGSIYFFLYTTFSAIWDFILVLFH